MLYYLNNWRNRAHAKIYGEPAMFDLWADGTEDKRALEMSSGDTCLILSRSGKSGATLGQYVFLRAVRGPDDPVTKRGVWVLEGKLSTQESLPKADAFRHPMYARFFNKKGHVCQWSVLRDA
jgi:hypothetical protein